MKPRLFFWCYDHQRRLGGQKHTYAQVDGLNRRGFDAYVLHSADGFRLTWFENATRVVGPSELQALYDRERDIVVVPEDLGERIATLPGKKVIFNKSAFTGFRVLGLDGAPPYSRPDILATLVVSERDARLMRYAFPSLRVHVTRPGIDVARFTPRPLRDKQRRIGWVAKNQSAVVAVRQILTARRLDLAWVELANLDEKALIATLQDCLLTLCLGVEEGYGLLPREALLCGCAGVAFDGGTLDELPRELVRAPNDVLGICELVEQIAADPEPWQAVVDRGRASVARHTLDAADDEAAAAWTAIIRA